MMPATNVIVYATFVPEVYTIETSVIPENTGTITVQETATYDEQVTVTATPNEGYQLKRLYYYYNAGGGVNPEFEIENGTFAMPATNIVVAAEFEPIPAQTYAIAISSYENGAITADKSEAAVGETVTLTITPIEGYKLETISVKAGYTEATPAGINLLAEGDWVELGNVELTKVDDTHYSFVIPENPDYNANTEFRVEATFVEDSQTGIDGIYMNFSSEARYVNPMGQVSDRPFKGLNIVIDGNKTYKIVVK